MAQNYLQDQAFLKELDYYRNKEQWVKITVLDWNENPVDHLEGKATGGSISVAGNSTVRRTASLTLAVSDDDYSYDDINSLLFLNKKVKIEVGITNPLDKYTEEEILWFPQGIFIIYTLSLTHSTTSTSISVTLKDKMCLLNGEIAGLLPASTTFNEYETIDENNNIVTSYPTIYQIIQELVNHFGGEQLGKIIISDIDLRIKKTMKWNSTSPLYYYTYTNSSGVTQTVYTTDASNYNESTGVIYEYGDDVGYIYTDFIYTDDLIGDAGTAITTILDKIKSYLGGNYEYFYDVDGNFVFQEIKNYLNTSQTTTLLADMINSTKNDYIIDLSNGKAVYTFDDSTLFTSYSNAPQYNMIKNDFIIWGQRETASGTTVDIRYHLAIDAKPAVGNTYKCFMYTDPDDSLTKAKVPIEFDTTLDIDTIKASDTLYKSILPTVGNEGTFYMIYNTSTKEYAIYTWYADTQAYTLLDVTLIDITTKDWRQELYLSGIESEPFGTDSNYYFTELKTEWPKLYDIKNGEYYTDVLETQRQSNIDYFLDFIDTTTNISKFSVDNIGRRQYVEVDDDVNCIFAPEVPDIVFIEIGSSNQAELTQECIEKGQDYYQLESEFYNALTGGGTSNSAYDKVRQMLYQYTSYNESITLQCIPIFYLQPNTRITVKDAVTGINGDYMITTLTVPLAPTSQMSISCTKALERF